MSMRLGLELADGKVERVCDRCFVLLQSVQRKDRGTTGKKVGAVTHQDCRWILHMDTLYDSSFAARGREATTSIEATFSSLRGHSWRGGAQKTSASQTRTLCIN